ncbi:MAG: diguanylate cyclase domain-containing protein, partial [Candidatus Dormibacteria bacterium]
GLSGPAEAEATAARFQDALRRSHSVGDQEVTVSASIGIAIPDVETSGLEALLGEADTAMYRAKAAGGGCSRVFDDSLGPVAQP